MDTTVSLDTTEYAIAGTDGAGLGSGCTGKTSMLVSRMCRPSDLESTGMSGGTAAVDKCDIHVPKENVAPPGSSNVPDVKPGSISMLEHLLMFGSVQI